MGIINSKERILDTIITEYGREKISKGSFEIKYAIFSDSGAYYEADALSGSSDASSRISIETVSLDRDRVTPSVSQGDTTVFGLPSNYKIVNGKIYEIKNDGSCEEIDQNYCEFLTDELDSAFENLKKLNIIGTDDFLFERNTFTISNREIVFDIVDNEGLTDSPIKKINIDQADGVYQDKKVSQINNYRYLPPINKRLNDDGQVQLLGHYEKLNQESYNDDSGKQTYEQILKTLRNKPKEVIKFSETSRENNITGQFFEIGDRSIKGLDIIDFGSFPTPDPKKPDLRVFFVGKLYKDSIGVSKYINIFTLILE